MRKLFLWPNSDQAVNGNMCGHKYPSALLEKSGKEWLLMWWNDLKIKIKNLSPTQNFSLSVQVATLYLWLSASPSLFPLALHLYPPVLYFYILQFFKFYTYHQPRSYAMALKERFSSQKTMEGEIDLGFCVGDFMLHIFQFLPPIFEGKPKIGNLWTWISSSILECYSTYQSKVHFNKSLRGNQKVMGIVWRGWNDVHGVIRDLGCLKNQCWVHRWDEKEKNASWLKGLYYELFFFFQF